MKQILFLFIIFLVACGTQPAPVVDEPTQEAPFACGENYYEFKKGDCCLDKNNNNICDKDEKEPEVVEEKEGEMIVEVEQPEEEWCPIGEGTDKGYHLTIEGEVEAELSNGKTFTACLKILKDGNGVLYLKTWDGKESQQIIKEYDEEGELLHTTHRWPKGDKTCKERFLPDGDMDYGYCE